MVEKAALVATLVLASWVLSRKALVVIVVVGASMEPALHAGNVVLATRWWPRRWLRRGQIVLIRGLGGAERGPKALMIKRVGGLMGDRMRVNARTSGSNEVMVGRDEIFVVSDVDAMSEARPRLRGAEPHAIDSREWGPIPIRSVAGKALFRLRQ